MNVKEIEAAREQLKLWSELYYKGEPEVTDEVFDAAMRQLQVAERKLGVTKLSPTQVVGDVSPSDKVGYKQTAHHVPMLSLRTEVDTSQLPIVEFLERIHAKGFDEQHAVIEYKYDGIGLDLQYVVGKLKAAVTRGDTMVGEDVTHLVQYMGDGQIPLDLCHDITMDIRGEVFIGLKDFRELNEEAKKKGEKEFANPRNLAAGLLRRHDPVDTHYFLRFVAYEAPWGEGEEWEKYFGGKDHLVRMHNLNEEGFNTRVQMHYPATGPRISTEEDRDIYAEIIYGVYMEAIEKRNELDFQIDGLVYKVLTQETRDTMGVTGREPNWAIAHKFPAATAQTKLLEINLTVGRTGRITPVAKLQPVLCGGVTISSATLVNEKRIKELGLNEGDTVLVQRAGDTIPEVLAVTHKEDPLEPCIDTEELFSYCPSCNSILQPEGAFHFCRNMATCDAQKLRLMCNAVSRSVLNIKNLGEVSIHRLIETEDLKDISDIFSLSEEKLMYAGIAKSTIPSILEHVEAARRLPAHRVLMALGIEGLGPATAIDLLEHFKTIAMITTAPVQELIAVRGISTHMAYKLRGGFGQSARVINKLLYEVENSWSHIPTMSNGYTVAITGSFRGYTRFGLTSALMNGGFIVTKNVNGSLDLLLEGDGAKAHKVEKAKQLGVAVAGASSIEGLVRAGTATILALKEANAKKDK